MKGHLDMENSTLHLSTNGVAFAHSISEFPRRLNRCEAAALVTASGDQGCRFVLQKAAGAAGYSSRYYPKQDKFVNNRLKKASTARLAHWAQGVVTKV
jgi:hypothetical protein